MSRRNLVAAACALFFLIGQHYVGGGLATVAFGQTQKTSAEKEKSRELIIPENVEFEENVEYGRAGDRSLVLDLARPKKASAKPRPVVVWIHGGGWVYGNKSISRVLPFVASGDYVGVAIGYRLSREAIWPACIHDCKAAIRWLKANARKYNIDPERIGVFGHSAGGHLAVLLLTSGDVDELEGESGSAGQSSRVACGIGLSGMYDFVAVKDFERKNHPNLKPPAHPQGPEYRLFGGPLETKTKEMIAASPVTYATKDDPPCLLVHGTEDPTAPYDQAVRMNDALSKAGCDVTLIRIDGGGHAVPNRGVRDFFARHLLGQDVKVSADP